MVVEPNSVSNNSAGLLKVLESLTMHALIFKRTDATHYHVDMLRAVGSDELLLRSVALEQRFIVAARKD